jgi:hypothetical protein
MNWLCKIRGWKEKHNFGVINNACLHYESLDPEHDIKPPYPGLDPEHDIKPQFSNLDPAHDIVLDLQYPWPDTDFKIEGPGWKWYGGEHVERIENENET